jgi:hypothetical protein
MNDNILAIGSYVFPIAKATFRYITDDGEGNPGWEFDIRTKKPRDLSPKSILYGRLPRFYSEGDPIPLKNARDLMGTQIHLKDAYDPDSGKVYFTLYVFEHGDLINVRMRFLEKKGKSYRIKITATVPEGTVFSTPKRLRIETWIKQLPDGHYG